MPTTGPAVARRPKTGSTPSLLNEAQLASLTKSEEICRTALKANYLLALFTLEDGEEPGEDDVSEAALKAALQTDKNTQTGQTGAIGEASGTRIDRNSLVEQATERRLWLQFAADAEWPHTDPANTPIRREFQLPATRLIIEHETPLA